MELNDNERYYFSCVLRRLHELDNAVPEGARGGLGDQALADEIDWLDCWLDARGLKDVFIPKREPTPEPEEHPEDTKFRWVFELHRNHIEFGATKRYFPGFFYYFYWCSWNKKHERQWGYYKTWYDGPRKVLHLWFFSISWSLPWFMGKSDDYFL